MSAADHPKKKRMLFAGSDPLGPDEEEIPYPEKGTPEYEELQAESEAALDEHQRKCEERYGRPRERHSSPKQKPERKAELAPVVPLRPRTITSVPASKIEMRSVTWLEKPIWQGCAFQLLAAPKGVGKGTNLAGLVT